MKKVNIVLFGVGKVGSVLIQQILALKDQLEKTGELEINIPVIVNSTTAFFEKKGVSSTWEADFKNFGVPYKLQDIIDYVNANNYENLIAVDATASDDIVHNYTHLVKNGFNLVAANKVANTLSTEFYNNLRTQLLENRKQFLYETNVGAGLPVVETLRNLHASGEKVTRVRGVFSGSLSYIFNTFSESDKTFDTVLTDAGLHGFTEPDPRMDLSGKDVARKLLILARELKVEKELSEIKIQDLVPVHLNGGSSKENFLKNKEDLNEDFEILRNSLKRGEVIRHIGELNIATGELEVKLVTEEKSSPFGSLRHADASFEIYTESYGERPLVIQGAGAGAAVTARGLLTDIIKLSGKIN